VPPLWLHMTAPPSIQTDDAHPVVSPVVSGLDVVLADEPGVAGAATVYYAVRWIAVGIRKLLWYDSGTREQRMKIDLTGRRALIAGGSRGIGLPSHNHLPPPGLR